MTIIKWVFFDWLAWLDNKMHEHKDTWVTFTVALLISLPFILTASDVARTGSMIKNAKIVCPKNAVCNNCKVKGVDFKCDFH